MDKDDRQVGHILSRRDALKLLGLTGASLLVGCVPGVQGVLSPTLTPVLMPTVSSSGAVSTALPACVVRPEVTEGPYYVDEGLKRSDIRSDPSSGSVREGAPLKLIFNISQVGAAGCSPLAGVKVDVWHCDAAGIYSDVSDRSFNTKGQKFLRGYQDSDDSGQAVFETIYPGWYPGRTVHIHFKIQRGTSARSFVFTSQLFFEDALSDQVFANQPYAGRGQRDTLNSQDGIYKPELLVNVRGTQAGYTAVFDLGLQLS